MDLPLPSNPTECQLQSIQLKEINTQHSTTSATYDSINPIATTDAKDGFQGRLVRHVSRVHSKLMQYVQVVYPAAIGLLLVGSVLTGFLGGRVVAGPLLLAISGALMILGVSCSIRQCVEENKTISESESTLQLNQIPEVRPVKRTPRTISNRPAFTIS